MIHGGGSSSYWSWAMLVAVPVAVVLYSIWGIFWYLGYAVPAALVLSGWYPFAVLVYMTMGRNSIFNVNSALVMHFGMMYYHGVFMIPLCIWGYWMYFFV